MGDVIAEYERAVAAKAAIEAEIEAVGAELTSGSNPGLHGPLVDAEGFPRADIDVYRVRQLRHTLAVRRTDHQQVMTQIEALLPQVFAARGGGKTELTPKAPQEPPADEALQRLEAQWKQKLAVVGDEERRLRPFAAVQSVQSASPAQAAGLQAGDQVLRFGSADADNHRQLAAVRDIVQRNVGSGIRVLVRRLGGQEQEQEQEQVLALELTPQTWAGPGVLGCLLQPL